ncbi:hypothetical protein KKC22_09435, partial [Myxococcota bacterium]|nr:hypothetical protein [Myxococcota bacterium]
MQLQVAQLVAQFLRSCNATPSGAIGGAISPELQCNSKWRNFSGVAMQLQVAQLVAQFLHLSEVCHACSIIDDNCPLSGDSFMPG